MNMPSFAASGRRVKGVKAGHGMLWRPADRKAGQARETLWFVEDWKGCGEKRSGRRLQGRLFPIFLEPGTAVGTDEPVGLAFPATGVALFRYCLVTVGADGDTPGDGFAA